MPPLCVAQVKPPSRLLYMPLLRPVRMPPAQSNPDPTAYITVLPTVPAVVGSISTVRS